MCNPVKKNENITTNFIICNSVGDPDPDLFVGSGFGNVHRIRITDPKGAYTNQKR
jgi:hypothetical protein